MAKSRGDMSVAELERMLSTRKSKLGGLLKKRDRLRRDLADVEQQINAIVGRGGRKRGGKRPQNAMSLAEHVVDILGRNKKGLTLSVLADRILKAGYKTNSSNFKNVLYQCIYNHKQVYYDDKTLTHRLKK